MAVIVNFSDCPRVSFLINTIIQWKTVISQSLAQKIITPNISDLKTSSRVFSQIYKSESFCIFHQVWNNEYIFNKKHSDQYW